MITIEQFADIIGVNLIIMRYSNQNNRYSAYFENADVKNSKESGVLISAYGNGMTPYEAIEQYCQKIRGKYLVINSMKENRMEYHVPEILMMKKY